MLTASSAIAPSVVANLLANRYALDMVQTCCFCSGVSLDAINASTVSFINLEHSARVVGGLVVIEINQTLGIVHAERLQ